MSPGQAFLTGLAWFGVGVAFLVMVIILATLASLAMYIIRTVVHGVGDEVRLQRHLTPAEQIRRRR